MDAEREARTEERRRHDTLVAQLTSKIPAIEAPQEASEAPETAQESSEAAEPGPPDTYRRSAGGCTEAVVEEGVRSVRQQTMKLLLVALAICALAALWNGVVWPLEPARPFGAGADTRRQISGETAVILGAFIGGGSAALAAYLADIRRFKREDGHRDHAERRQSYYEYLAAWETYEEVRTRLDQPFTPNRISALPELRQAQLKLLSRYNALSLLAPTYVRREALGMREGKPGAPGLFWKAARKDLGIPPDPPDTPPEGAKRRETEDRG
jgi:hypothetical protein